ncbi:Bug family tripartite tricarboxylate transporter substrate binding protein [Roseomonas harenae]|jgi:tripartite-type tricarboxylate transporter receptor subunit TctC|uniref:Bug family tripartite tricarboxylate transporter substrate binding protein n=1 Tax=Muricoccus harenae TaxID=2692566 RepID=UPI0013318F65|nr:tripartite tricarboxylate transporter substrate-binding protein [Roseomonas harenae]
MRRRILGLAAFGLSTPSLARAQEVWPVRTVRLIVPQAPGSPIEIPTRIIADHLTRSMGANFIVESRPGAGGGIGSQYVAQQPPDGATFLATSAGISIIPTLQPALGFDPIRDLDPVCLMCDVPSGLLVRRESPFSSLPQLLAHAKSRPGDLTYASGGVGSANHLAGALFSAMAGVEMTHVPYRGVSQAVTAVYSGDIALIFGSTLELLQHVRQNRARILGVTMPARVPALPDVPAIAEYVPGYAAPNWFCLMAPKGLPPPLMARLTTALAQIRSAPELQARMAEGAATARLDGPAPLAERIAEEVPKWRNLVVQAGIRPE